MIDSGDQAGGSARSGLLLGGFESSDEAPASECELPGIGAAVVVRRRAVDDESEVLHAGEQPRDLGIAADADAGRNLAVARVWVGGDMKEGLCPGGGEP